MVPTSLIKKMYGKSVIAEVVNKALQEAVYNYIKDNKVNMLGERCVSETALIGCRCKGGNIKAEHY